MHEKWAQAYHQCFRLRNGRSRTSFVATILVKNLLLHDVFKFLTFCYSHLASNATAWQQLLGVPGLLMVDPPLKDFKWGITGGQNSLSLFHIDGNGTGTAVVVTTGGKYWILGRERRNVGVVSKVGNLGSMHAFPKEWHPSTFQNNFQEYEAVHLTAGTAL